MASLILTLVGPDRPGLVSALAARVAEAGGSWLESRLARLAGQFAGVVRVDIPAADERALAAMFATLEDQGLHVAVHHSAHEASDGEHTTATLVLTGLDRPGIVRDLSRVLAARSVNIEELSTTVESGSFSGETMFRAEAVLRIPVRLSVADIRTSLEGLGNDMMVDVKADKG